ncbi:MAG: DUF1802 family protein [Planctomycetes bacterium]|nr:DUF1802 family protein [Planctomycetota bacterium]
MIQYAFKEWAVICRALAEGRQSLILRKGGVAEDGGVFRPEHSRFWLFPTYVHQQKDGIKTEAIPLLKLAEAEKPPAGILRLTHFAEVSGVHYVPRLEDALALDKLHLWSGETVMQRFAYRESGLYVLAVRIYRVATPLDVPMKPEFDGCKTWVELDNEPSTNGAVPVLDDRRFVTFLEELDAILNPTALA